MLREARIALIAATDRADGSGHCSKRCGVQSISRLRCASGMCEVTVEYRPRTPLRRGWEATRSVPSKISTGCQVMRTSNDWPISLAGTE